MKVQIPPILLRWDYFKISMETKQVFKNAKWIIACKIVQSVIQLIIGMITARYLGPSNYGLISYAASIVAFFLPVMRLGLNAILVRELVEAPEKEGKILGTSLFMNILSSIFCIIGVSAFSFVANRDSTEAVIVCILYSTSIFFAAIEMLQYWFQYKLLSKYSSISMLGAYIAVSLYKIFLLVTGKSIYWFALSHSVEYGLIGLLLLWIYISKRGARLSFSASLAKEMLGRSKHYILSAMMVVIFQNTDHIMLTAMSGTAENGFYSAAITSVGVVQFVYIAITDSFRPLILSAKKENQIFYERNISRLYGIIIYLSLAQSIFFTLLARFIIGILYGEHYIAAVPVMQILTWYLAFSYMGVVRNIWLLAEEKQKYLPLINLSGVAVNILINAVLIPKFGACGAAFASFITQVFANFILGFVFKPIKENNRLLLKGINPRFFFSELKAVIGEVLGKKIK